MKKRKQKIWEITPNEEKILLENIPDPRYRSLAQKAFAMDLELKQKWKWPRPEIWDSMPG